jgi:hypothetical protein
MAYAEVFLGRVVNWNTYPNVSRNGVPPNRAQTIPQNDAVPLDDNEVNQDIAGAVAQVVAAVNPAHVQAGLQGPALVDVEDVEDVGREGGPQDLDQPMVDQPGDELDGLVGGVPVVNQELQLAAMEPDRMEIERRYQADLEVRMAQMKALTEENARLVAYNTELLARARRMSGEEIPGLDEIVERATYGLVDAPPTTNPFVVRARNTFPPAQFRGESSNAAAQPTTQGGEEMVHISRDIYDALVARAEHAEAECANAKAQVDDQSKSIWDLNRQLEAQKAENTRLLLHNPAREEMLLAMSNMKLTSNLAMNEVEQMQREVRRIAAEFGDGGQRHFGLTSWPRVEEMFPDTLPTLPHNSSIDWNAAPNLQFQFNTERYRYVQPGHRGPHPLLWPNVPNFVTNGSICIVCQEPFGPEGGWTVGTCGHVYHPVCLIPYMVTRKRCSSCKAPFHPRLYKMFGIQGHMPLHYEFDEDNLPGPTNRVYWGSDMLWMWKWGHDNRHLPYQNVNQIPFENDADVTEVCKRVIGPADNGRRVYFGQLAGGHWDVDRQVFVRRPHPENVLFDSHGNPMGIAGEMEPETALRYIEDTTFNEPQMLRAIIYHLHDRYDCDVVALLETLQSREELQNFLRNSIARGIVAPE